MNKLYWTLHVLVTLAIGLFGFQKVVVPIPDLIEQGMWWVADFEVWQVRAIGALEVLGVLGMNLPYLIKALPKVLVPLASGGLAITMIGAIGTHITRQDPAPSIVITGILFAVCAALTLRRAGEVRHAHAVA